MNEIITVKEMFDYAMEFDMKRLAHQIFWAITADKVQLTDDSNRLLKIHFDTETVQNMTEQNVLGLGRVKLYVVPSFNWYAFYYAKNILEVSGLHKSLFNEHPSRIIESPSLQTKVMYFVDLDIEYALIDYKKTIVEFPIYLGHAAPKEYHLYRLDRQQGGKKIV